MYFMGILSVGCVCPVVVVLTVRTLVGRTLLLSSWLPGTVLCRVFEPLADKAMSWYGSVHSQGVQVLTLIHRQVVAMSQGNWLLSPRRISELVLVHQCV